MATEYDLAKTQYDHYRFAYDNGHEEWMAKAQTCFEFWRGNQWDEKVLAQLKLEGRPALSFNVIESLVRSMLGIQRALRNDVRFLPVSGANNETARVQDALWLHIQQQNNLDFLETEVYQKGLIMGRAYYDVRVKYNDSFQGEVRICSPRSQDIILDPSIDTYDPAANWPRVFHRRWVSYHDIVTQYGREKAEAIGYRGMPEWMYYEDKFMAQQMGRLPYYRSEPTEFDILHRAYLLLDQQYKVFKKKKVFVDLQTGDVSEIPETWDRNRIAAVLEATPGVGVTEQMRETIRWVTTCEEVVLHDEDSPYKQYTVIPFFPSFVDGVTLGAVESLIDAQQLYNKITSQELHIINTTANSGWIVKRDALANMNGVRELEQFGSKPGTVIEVNGNVSDAIQKITPNSTPQGHDRLSFKADQIMRSLSGVSNQSRGFAREDVAGEAILANQAAQDINFAGWLGNLHRTKQMLATRVLDCVQAHYTDTRVILINRGSSLQPEVEEIHINQPTPEGQVLNDVTQGKYTTTLIPAPARASMTEEDFKLMLMLRREIGMAIPDNLLLELSPATNKAQIIQALQGDSNERQREAEALEAQRAQIEQQKALAQARKEEAAAQLNQARAEKAAIEAASEPDAAYERVETQRIAAEAAVEEQKIMLEAARMRAQQNAQDRQLDLRAEELEIKRALAAQKASNTHNPRPETPR